MMEQNGGFSQEFKKLDMVTVHAHTVLDNRPFSGPNFDDFIDVPGFSTKIEKDKALIEAKEKEIKDELDRIDKESRYKKVDGLYRSTALETVVICEGKESKWFGSETGVDSSSKFDNWKRKMDFYLELGKNGHRRLVLIADITRTINVVKIEEKMSGCISHLLKRELGIRYFRSPIDGFKGSLEGCIPIVLGVDPEISDKLITDSAEIIGLEKKPRIERNYEEQKRLRNLKESFSKNPVQILFLKEAQCQLEMYKKILGKNESNSIFLNDVIEPLLTKINNILEEKNSIVTHPQTVKLLENSKAYKAIRNFVDNRIKVA